MSTSEKPECADGNHAWDDEYYGTRCTKCGLFYPFGCAPWDDNESDDGGEGEEEWDFDCHMGSSGVCGAAGSEECEFECPYRRLL
jgi:hypothetical protein